MLQPIYIAHLIQGISKVGEKMKRITLALIASASLLLVFASSVLGDMDEVGPATRGGTIYVGPDRTYTSIQQAIDAAVSGDEIYVDTGTYYEDLMVSKTVHLYAADGASPVIMGTNTTSVITLNASDCTIQGFEIREGAKKAWCAGVFINSDDNLISDCTFINNRGGIVMNNDSSGNTIRNSEFRENKDVAIRSLGWSSQIEIQECKMTDNGGGMTFTFSNNISVSDCYIRSQWQGIYCYGCVDFTFTVNTIAHHADVDDQPPLTEGMLLWDCSRMDIVLNDLIDNQGPGIELRSTDNCNIINNMFDINGDVGLGIDIQPHMSGSSSTGNRIIGNIFRNNSLQAVDNGIGNVWTGDDYGNYWSDHTTPDIDGDLIVDKPYLINGSAGSNDTLPVADHDIYLGPKLSPPDNVTATVDTYYYGQFTVDDIDTELADQLWLVHTDAEWLSFNDGIINGTPSQFDTGTYFVNVTIDDVRHISCLNITLTVVEEIEPEVPANNTPPSIPKIETDSYEYSNGESVVLRGTSEDVEGTDLTYTWSSNISGYLGAGEVLNISSLPPGVHEITLNVTDEGGASSESSITITILEGTTGEIDENSGKPDIAIVVLITIGLVIVTSLFVIILSLARRPRQRKNSQITIRSNDVPVHSSVRAGGLSPRTAKVSIHDHSGTELDHSSTRFSTDELQDLSQHLGHWSDDQLAYEFTARYRKGEISKRTYDNAMKALKE